MTKILSLCGAAVICCSLSMPLEAGTMNLADAPNHWTFQPEWVSLPSPNHSLTGEGKLVFTVEPGLEGKWSRPLGVATRNYDKLEFTYRAKNFNAAPGDDFFLYIETDLAQPARRFLINRDEVRDDGELHALTFDLKKEFPGATLLKQAVIHVLGSGGKPGWVEIQQFQLTGPDAPAFDAAPVPKAARHGETGFELDRASLKKLKSHPTWCGGIAAKNYSFAAIADRFVMHAENGEMKWSLPVSVATDEYGFMVLTYRTCDFNAAPGDDFFIHLDTSAMGAARKSYAVPREALAADGKWHTIVVDLRESYGEGSINQVVFHAVPFENASVTVEIGELLFCSESGKAKAAGSAKLLSEVRFTEEMKIARRDPAEVTWPRGDAAASAMQNSDGTVFQVPTSGAVMRWNCIVSAPVALAPGQIIEMRYRAENLDDNPEGVIFLGWNVVNDSVPENMRPVTFNSFVSDGLWRIARAPVPAGVESAWTFAVMVRAGERGNGTLTVDYLRFYDSIPENRLEQSMKVTPLAAPPQGFAAIPLPAGNHPADVLRKYFTPASYPAPGLYEWDGVAFEISEKLRGTAMKGPGEIAIDLSDKSISELYLLLGARFSGNNSPAIARGRLSAVSEPERLLCELVYADGTSEELFPANAANGRHTVREGLGVYALVPSFRKQVRTLKIREWMDNGALYLAGVTANCSAKRRLPLNWHAAPPYFKRSTAALPDASPTKIDLKNLALTNRYLKLSLDPADPLRIRSLVNRLSGKELIDGKSDARLFDSGEKTNVTGVSQENGSLALKIQSANYEGTVLLAGTPEFGRIRVDASIRRTGKLPGIAKADFPSLDSLLLPEGGWWFYPKLGFSAGSSDVDFTGRYGGVFPFQIMGFFSPQQESGLYIQGLDEQNFPKDFRLSRKETRGSLKITSCPVLCVSGEAVKLSPFAIGVNPGDYRNQAKIYKAFLDERQWSRQPAKNWLRERFMLFEIYAHHGFYQLFDTKTGEFTLDESMKLLTDRFGGVDMFHFFDFGITERNGRVGDYDYTGMLGKPGTLERFLKEAKEEYQVPTSLYIEGNLASADSKFIARNGRDGQRISITGEKLLYPGTTDELFMCPEYRPWREHLDSLAATLLKKTGAKAFYLDEFGYGGPDRTCYAFGHEHAVPGYAMPGEMKILETISKTLREIDPEYAILSEASPNDVNMQYQDGSLSSAISEYRENGNMARTDLYRYFFPGYKSFQIIALHDVIGDGYAPYKLAWFNGSGLMLSGDPTEDYSETTCAFLRFMNRTYKANREYFSSDRVEVDLPYGATGVFVNEFSAENGKLYTLFNANYRSASGVTLRIPGGKAASVRDVLGVDLPSKVKDGVLEIECPVSPRGVNGVVVGF